MNLGGVFDVGIGLVLTYLISALIASAVKEAIAGVFQWRGKYLAKGIDVLLSTSTNASFSWGGAWAAIAAHLAPAGFAPTPSAQAPVAAPAATPQLAALQKVRAVVSHPLLKGTPSKLPSYVPSHDFSAALLDMLRDGSADPAITQIERTVGDLPDCDVKRVLTAFIDAAAGDLDALRIRIETWFDDAMDRLSGIYKRFAQYFLLALGLLIAVGLNVDSVHLAEALWTQPPLRAQMVTNAQVVVGQTNPTTPASITQEVADLNALPVPIGRNIGASFFGEQPAATGRSLSAWHGWNWWAILGWVITAFAISLGAPFWFDLLQNFMSIRNAGPQPKRADAPP